MAFPFMLPQKKNDYITLFAQMVRACTHHFFTKLVFIEPSELFIVLLITVFNALELNISLIQKPQLVRKLFLLCTYLHEFINKSLIYLECLDIRFWEQSGFWEGSKRLSLCKYIIQIKSARNVNFPYTRSPLGKWIDGCGSKSLCSTPYWSVKLFVLHSM